jgi:hypothetical protein
MKDKLGQEIKIGSIIAYGHALGRCAGIRIGKVLDLKESLGRYDRMEYKITVIGIDDDWSNTEPKLNQRKGTLLYPEILTAEFHSPRWTAIPINI